MKNYRDASRLQRLFLLIQLYTHLMSHVPATGQTGTSPLKPVNLIIGLSISVFDVRIFMILLSFLVS